MTFNINAGLPKDLFNTIAFLVDSPLTFSRVCKRWKEVQNDLCISLQSKYSNNPFLKPLLPEDSNLPAIKRVSQVYIRVTSKAKSITGGQLIIDEIYKETGEIKLSTSFLAKVEEWSEREVAKAVIEIFKKVLSRNRQATDLEHLFQSAEGKDELELAKEIREWTRGTEGQICLLEKDLFISRKELNVLPPEIGLFTRLELLHLNDNNLHTLPQEVGQLHKLRSIDLSRNQFEEIPEMLKQLPNLTLMGFIGNKRKQPDTLLGQIQEACRTTWDRLMTNKAWIETEYPRSDVE